MGAPLSFTRDEWSRPHGVVVESDVEVRRWDAVRMAWVVTRKATGRSTVICPDHERARRDPEAVPVLATMARLTRPGRHLRLVR
jgi:3-polyprenyl-4-hydroxybenzoate decarboxylase